MSKKRKKQLRTAILIFVLATVGSFIAQLMVQFFMGGINDFTNPLMRSLAIGAGMALFIFFQPGSKEVRYPWQ